MDDQPTSSKNNNIHIAELLTIADDFGLHRDINSGILDCIKQHRLTGISVSSNGKALDFSVLNDIKNKVEIGAHLTLVGEQWITKPIFFKNWAALFSGIMTKKINVGDIEAECRQQILSFINHDIPLSHMDSHQHIHVFPLIWPIVKALQTEFLIPRIRVPFAPSLYSVKRSVGGVGLQYLAAQKKGEGFPCIGLRFSGRNTLDLLNKELRHIQKNDTYEWVAHPGVNSSALQTAYGDWKYDWEMEKAVVMSERFLDVLSSHRCTLKLKQSS